MAEAGQGALLAQGCTPRSDGLAETGGRIKSQADVSARDQIGGESGIRTHGRFDPSPVFKTGALNRSAISPMLLRMTAEGIGCHALATRIARVAPDGGRRDILCGFTTPGIVPGRAFSHARTRFAWWHHSLLAGTASCGATRGRLLHVVVGGMHPSMDAACRRSAANRLPSSSLAASQPVSQPRRPDAALSQLWPQPLSRPRPRPSAARCRRHA